MEEISVGKIVEAIQKQRDDALAENKLLKKQLENSIDLDKLKCAYLNNMISFDMMGEDFAVCKNLKYEGLHISITVANSPGVEARITYR